jgi:hypothetical protein
VNGVGRENRVSFVGREAGGRGHIHDRDDAVSGHPMIDARGARR